MRSLLVFALSFCIVTVAKAGMPKDTVAALELHQVVTTGTRYATDIRHLPMTVSSLSREELTRDFRSSVLPTVSERVPGLFVTSRGMFGYGVSTGAAGSIKIRGVGGGARVLVLVDGQPQYAGLMGHPIADAYQTMMAEKVEVLRGPASLLYGSNAMGGVINIVTRQAINKPSETTVHLEGGSYGSFQGMIGNDAHIGRFSSSVGFSHIRTDGHRENSGFEQYSGYAKLGCRFSRHWKADGDFSLTRFNASNPGEISNPYIENDSKITRGLSSLQLTNNYENLTGAVRLFYDWGHHNINDGYHPGGVPQAQLYLHDDLMSGITAYESLSLFAGNRITAGFDYQHFGGKAWNRVIATGERKVLADRKQDEMAGYVEFCQELMRWMTLDAGVRVDHHTTSGTETVPQGGLTFRPSPATQVRAMVSKGFRNPTIRELYMFRPANKDLKPERSVNYEIAFSHNLPDNSLRYGINVFYLKADNLINTAMFDGRPMNVNTGRTENWGFETDVHCRLAPHWAFDANYSYLHTDNPTAGVPEHKLYAGTDFSAGKFSINTGIQYIAGLYLSDDKASRREYFALWNLTANYRVNRMFQFYARGENLLAQKYETMKGFPMPRATVAAGVKLQF